MCNFINNRINCAYRAVRIKKRSIVKVMDARKYDTRIETLTDRAKKNRDYIDDLDIGESCYLLSLMVLIRSFRMKLITSDELFHKQKELEHQLQKYYQWGEIFDRHVSIQNCYSNVLTEAEKTGCPVCRKLVRIFDGRN